MNVSSADLIPSSERHKITPLLGKHNLFFLCQITSPTATVYVRPYAELRALSLDLPFRYSHEKAVWYPYLRETLTGYVSLPQFFHAYFFPRNYYHNFSTPKHTPPPAWPAFHYPTARGMQYRVDPYDLKQPTHNTTAIEAPGRPQVFTSDGSLKKLADKLRAGTALIGVQNANLIFLAHLAGHQSVYKAELLALVLAAKTADHWNVLHVLLHQ